MGHSLLAARDKAVYRWEDKVLAPHDRVNLDPRTAQVVCNHVWSETGLLHPPKITYQRGLSGAHANRLEITVGDTLPHHWLFHEMAHCMDQSVETAVGATAMRPDSEVSGGSYHDENWLGLYVNMLDRYLNLPKLWLYGTLRDHGLTVSYAPKPRCI